MAHPSLTQRVYELNALVEPGLLRDALVDILIGDPQHNGVSYVLRTQRDVGAKQVLQRLLERGIEISFFRNVSSSIKSMFE